jgi:hypothetical protein
MKYLRQWPWPHGSWGTLAGFLLRKKPYAQFRALLGIEAQVCQWDKANVALLIEESRPKIWRPIWEPGAVFAACETLRAPLQAFWLLTHWVNDKTEKSPSRMHKPSPEHKRPLDIWGRSALEAAFRRSQRYANFSRHRSSKRVQQHADFFHRQHAEACMETKHGN